MIASAMSGMKLRRMILLTVLTLGVVIGPLPVTAQDQLPDEISILVMGVDRRPGEPIDSGVRPDALGVLHLDITSGSCRLLSIPRDTRASLPGYGQSKINHAYAFGGVELERSTVEGLLGIELDRYGLIDMDGFAQMIDAVGGITVDDPEVFELGAYVYESSPQTLNGQQALMYSRYRGGADGDFGRIRRQQQVIRSFLASQADLDLETFFLDVVPTLTAHTRTDMSIDELLALAMTFRSACTAETIGTDFLIGESALAYDDIYQQDLWMVLVDPGEVANKVAWLLGG